VTGTASEHLLVCVVDDDAALRDSLHWLLTSAGYAVRAYASGEHFLREYDPAATVCVVLDVQLPGASGFAVQEALRAQGGVPRVIFISGRVSPGVAAARGRAERSVLLEKPFNGEELLDLIDRAAERHAARAKELSNAA
jgi:FixJ family two-component response regulator